MLVAIHFDEKVDLRTEAHFYFFPFSLPSDVCDGYFGPFFDQKEGIAWVINFSFLYDEVLFCSVFRPVMLDVSPKFVTVV